MPIWVSLHGAPKEDGDSCPVFNPAVWWPGWELIKDARFRVTDSAYFYSVACLSVDEMGELQDRYRHRAEGLDHWKRDSDRLDRELAGAENYGRYWVVSVYEWESGVDDIEWEESAGEEGEQGAASDDIVGHGPPDPRECPDCGSRSVVPISYGLPGPEMQEKGRRGEIVLGGCTVRDPRWHCKNCFNSWPEDPPPTGLDDDPDWLKRHLREIAAEYASLIADAELPGEPDEPVVENYWERADGRKVFLLRFPWGRMRIEKRVHLLAFGGAPQYELIAGFPPKGVDYVRARRQSALAALRFERRPSA